jgi:protein tyrosine phosphatase
MVHSLLADQFALRISWRAQGRGFHVHHAKMGQVPIDQLAHVHGAVHQTCVRENSEWHDPFTALKENSHLRGMPDTGGDHLDRIGVALMCIAAREIGQQRSAQLRVSSCTGADQPRMGFEFIEVTTVSARLEQFRLAERNCRVEEFAIHHQAGIFTGNECLRRARNIVNRVGLAIAAEAPCVNRSIYGVLPHPTSSCRECWVSHRFFELHRPQFVLTRTQMRWLDAMFAIFRKVQNYLPGIQSSDGAHAPLGSERVSGIVDSAIEEMEKSGLQPRHEMFGEDGSRHMKFMGEKSQVLGGSRYRSNDPSVGQFRNITVPRDAKIVPGTTIQPLTLETRDVFRCQSPKPRELAAFMTHVANSETEAIVVLVSDAEYAAAEKKAVNSLPKYFSPGPHNACDESREVTCSWKSVENSRALAEAPRDVRAACKAFDLSISNPGSGDKVTKSVIQMTGWPDHGAPDPRVFAKLAGFVSTFVAGAAMVHCKAGVGRTGTLLAAIAGVELAAQGRKDCSLERIVIGLRKQGPTSMVQTREQLQLLARFFESMQLPLYIEDEIHDSANPPEDIESFQQAEHTRQREAGLGAYRPPPELPASVGRILTVSYPRRCAPSQRPPEPQQAVRLPSRRGCRCHRARNTPPPVSWGLESSEDSTIMRKL